MSTMPPPPQFPVTQLEIDEPPTWPKTIGIVSIVWASLGLTCSVCYTGSYVFVEPIMGFAMKAAAQQSGGTASSAANVQVPPAYLPNVLDWVTVILWVGITGFLLFAGITLVKRRVQGRTFHLAYAVASVFITGLRAFAEYSKQTEIQAWIAANPDIPFAKQQAASPFASSATVIGVILTALVATIYPAFILIWFLFIKKNPAEIAAGVEEPL